MKLLIILMLSSSSFLAYENEEQTQINTNEAIENAQKCTTQYQNDEYKMLLEKADKCYHNCQLDKAKILYKKALKLKPNAELPQERIKNIDGINNSYNNLKQEAETAYLERNYLIALSKIRSAKKIHPCTTELDAREFELEEITMNMIVKVDNEVLFPKYKDYTMTDSVKSIQFKVIITNYSPEKIPDLGVSSRSENLNFYVNGELSNPISLYNGMEVIDGEKVIHPGDSTEYFVTWVLTPDSGILTNYGNNFSVQWEYCGIKSAVKNVNIEEQTAKFQKLR
jgi:tetratricopeptide (TPR) repeat protein